MNDIRRESIYSYVTCLCWCYKTKGKADDDDDERKQKRKTSFIFPKTILCCAAVILPDTQIRRTHLSLLNHNIPSHHRLRIVYKIYYSPQCLTLDLSVGQFKIKIKYLLLFLHSTHSSIQCPQIKVQIIGAVEHCPWCAATAWCYLRVDFDLSLIWFFLLQIFIELLSDAIHW